MNLAEKDILARQIMGDTHANAYRQPIYEYDKSLVADDQYKDSLPDIQDTIYIIDGGKRDIEHVGIHNFKLPLKYARRDGGISELETSITGTVSLDAEKRGIHMSRIVEQFYEYKDSVFNVDQIINILKDYKDKLGSFDARILLNISYPILQTSLRSNREGYQYYNVTFEVTLNKLNEFRKIIHFDYVYSSTCPCSYELSEHAREYRGVAATPHAQRSKSRVSVEFGKEFVWIEDIKDICLDALKTEVQVIVKRVDEQAFAELNAVNTKFVEDASRLLYSKLNACESIYDFKVVLSHLESLHPHNAIAIIVKGIEDGFTGTTSIEELNSLIC